MRKLLLSIAAVVCVIFAGLAQNKMIHGTVTDAQGNPVVGAAVVVTGTGSGVTTNSDGRFAVSAPADGTLDVSFLGFVTQRVEVNNQSNIKIALQEDTHALEEVIVVAFGQTTREAFTGSAGVVKADDIEKRQVSNITQALSGAVAGVQTLSSNGQPGVEATVRIRGIGSINAGTSPLYVVDGVPFDGDLSSINTQDIESMTVLKDAASAALYGARGANGVILINTKRGSQGRVNVNFEARWGVNSVATPNYDVMTDPGMYIEKAYEAIVNQQLRAGKSAADANIYANTVLPATTGVAGELGYRIYTVPEGQMLVGMNGKLNPNATLGYSDGEYYYTPDNWRKESMESNLRQEYNVNVSGGNDRANYYASLGYLDDKGIINNSSFTRYSMRLKGDYDVTKWLKIGGNMSYSYSNSTYPGEQTNTSSSMNVFRFANFIAPVYPMYVRDAEGNKMYDSRGKLLYDFGDGAINNGKRNFFHPGGNPVATSYYDQEEYLMDVFGANWFATVAPVKGLTLTARFGLDVDNTRYNYGGNAYYGQFAAEQGGYVYKQSSRTSGLDQQYIANYQVLLADKHNLDVMAGFESYSLKINSLDGTRNMLYNPNIYEIDNCIGTSYVYSSSNSYATMGVIARLNYDYDGRYFVSGSYRRDASSRFHPSHRWGNFFSASAAWMISKESWMENAEAVDILKLKASFGQQGNDSVGNYYAYMDQYKMTGSGSTFSDGVLYYKGNPDLTWETSNAFNVGVEFGFWRSRLSGSVEYFSRRSSDMLYYKPVNPSAGYSQIPMNVGSMTNSGVEIDLTAGLVRSKNVTWDFNVNATFLKNKINSLHPDLNGELTEGTRIYTEGKSMYQMYLPHYMGVNPEDGMPLYYCEDEDGTPGTTSAWAEATAFRRATGNLLPKVYGGFGTSLEFYGFDFSVQFAYQLGGRIYDSGYASLMHPGDNNNGGTNWHKDILKAWTPENPNTNVPRVDIGISDGRVNSASDRFLTSSNYLSLNNITLGYTLPKRWMSRAGIAALRIYLAADNVALVSARKGLDPRQSYISASTAYYSPIRTVSGGVKLTF